MDSLSSLVGRLHVIFAILAPKACEQCYGLSVNIHDLIQGYIVRVPNDIDYFGKAWNPFT